MLVGLALISGCISPSNGVAGMPMWVAISVDLNDGEQATMLVEFVAPEEPPNLLYGGGVLQAESPYINPNGDIHRSIAGVGRGFSIDETDSGIMLNLPHRSRSVPIFGPGATLMSVSWLDELSASVQMEVDDRYHAIERIRLSPEASRVDGDLDDWSGDKALPVDSASNIISRGAQWSGPRDASFGVAAHLHRGRLELGVRVRDDEALVGLDRLNIETEFGEWEIPLKDRGIYSLPNGAEVAFTERSNLGFGLEFGVPMGSHMPMIDDIHVIVRYLDVDGSDTIDSPVVISTSPSMDVLLISTPL